MLQPIRHTRQQSTLSRLERPWAFLRGASTLAAFLFLGGGSASAQTNVVTQHYDNARTGQNVNETILTPANVTTSTFGKLFSYSVDGWVYAQPLYMPGVIMGPGTPQAGTTHNVLFIATEHDGIYAFDADNNTGANANPLWQVTLLDSAHGAPAGATSVPNGDVSTGDIVPEIGITGTPVIDPVTNTMYVVGKTKENGTYVQRLHALDITTGAEKFSGPRVLAASVPGNGSGSSGGVLNWDVKWENNRPGLLLLNGIVYLGFGSHGDNGPWHGWILAYNASTLQQTGAWCASPNGSADGIWMSGSGLAADVPDPAGHPFGRMFTSTGNGTHTAVAPNYDNTMNYGDSIIKLDLANGVPTMNSGGAVVGDDFTPHDQANLNNGDTDQASGGVLLIPDAASGGKHLLTQVGKTGRVYILDRENLGGYNPNNTKDPGEKANVAGMWSMPAYWNGNLYYWGSGDQLRAFSFVNGVLSSNPTSISTDTFGFPGSTPTVSANGTTNGIVWDIRSDAYPSQGREVLIAYDATNVAKILYSSDTNVNRDNPGNAVKFTVPTVINGKVYVGAEFQVSVYGLLNGQQPAATPVLNPASESFNPSVQVTITDSTPNSSIFFTTDGSTPTTASTKYSGPISVTTTTTINAIATAAGFLQSPVASATYSLVTQAATPTFTPAPGSYTSAQSVTITTTTSNATIFFTTDGTTPTTSSTRYTGPVSIGVTNTLKAIATASNLSNSPVASGTYTIDIGGVSSINFGSGFAAGGMVLNGFSKLNGTRLRLTDGGATEAASAWFNVQANVQNFTTDFSIQITPGSTPTADGMTFAIEANSTSVIGPAGGGLGYGPDTPTGTGGIANSVAIKFDLFSNSGEGVNSTGIYVNGASPTAPFVNLTGAGIDLHSGHVFNVHMTYDGTNLTMTITDATTSAAFTKAFPINIPATIGSNSGFVGFTGGTGGLTAIQEVLNWTYIANGTQQTAATPTFSPVGGTYLGTQTVTLTDATPGASMFFTTNGTPPTTASTPYSGPITVTATETINAIATASGFQTSAVGTATYTIESQVATPTFTPGAGTFTSAQSVAINDATSGATIFYTLDGTTPGTAVGGSTKQYAGPIAVNATTTIKAIATSSGFFNSNVAAATFTISSTGVTSINLGSGFTAGAMVLNGSATLNTNKLRVTDAGINEASSAWFSSPMNIQTFTNNFSFQITPGTTPTGDGFTFTIQGNTTTALGPSGGGLGYGPDNVTGPSASPNPPIAKSVAVKFDLFSNSGEGVDSTGLYINGASPTAPFVSMTSSGVDLHSGHVFNVHMTYDGTNLTMTITDATTNGAFTHSWPINIPATVGSNAAQVGFTGGTGGSTAIQDILSWTMSTNLGAAATPTFSLPGGTYLGAQTVSLSDSTAGSTIFYTVDGTVPATSVGGSTKQYTGPISVSTTTTIKAIATASGFFNSNIATATYTINVAKAPIVFETENIPAVSSGPVFRTFGFGGFPDGVGTILDATKAGDNVTFTVNVAQPGTYDVKVAVKLFTTRGIWQLAVNGANVGQAQDEYANTGGTFAVFDLGTVNLTAAGNQTLKFTVVGKNAASSGFTISFDTITLTPQ